MKHRQRTQSTRSSGGFVLPAVIMLGVAILILGITNLSVIGTNSTTLNTQYYHQLAKEAAKAGATVAAQCVKKASDQGLSVSWTVQTLQLDCTGANVSGSSSVAAQDNWATSYSVSSPIASGSSISYVSTGTLTFYTDSSRTIQAIGQPTITETVKSSFTKTTSVVGTTPESPYTSKNVTDVSTGTNSMCAVALAKAYCWGDNANGQLGNGDARYADQSSPAAVSTSPVAIPADPGVCQSQVFNTCISWLRTPTPEVPISALAGKTVTKISRGIGNHTCAIADDKAYCWGQNNNGQLGNRTKIDSPVPVAVYDSPVAVPAFAGDCANSVFGVCISWRSPPTDAVPASPLAGKIVTDISVGLDSTCAIASGQAICWGNNDRGQLGTNDRTNVSAPTAVYTVAPKAAVVGVCKSYVFGICTSWDPAPSDATSASVMYNKTLVSISTGTDHTCSFDTTNVAYCWGRNDSGQLGDSISPPPPSGSAFAYAQTKMLNDGCNFILGTPPQRGPDPSTNDELQPTLVDAHGSYTKTNWWGGSTSVPASPLNGKVLGSIRAIGTYTGVLADGQIYWFGGPSPSKQIRNGNTTVSCIDKTPDNCQSQYPASANYCKSSVTVTSLINTYWNEWSYHMQSSAVGPVYTKTLSFLGIPIGSQTNALTGRSLQQVSGTIFGDDSCGSFFGLGSSCSSGASEGTFCAYTSDNLLFCDGPSFYFQYHGTLGDGTPANGLRFDTNGPVAVKMNGALAGKTITKLSGNVRGDYSCVIASGGLYCWGYNYNGRLGKGNTTDSPEPTSPDLSGDLGNHDAAPGSPGTTVTTYSNEVNY